MSSLRIPKIALTMLGAVCLSLAAHAQTPEQRPLAIEPKAADVATMDSIIHAVYEVISGPAGQKRDWDRMRSLFVPNASMGVAVRRKDGELRYIGFGLDRYISQNDKFITEKGFFERELHRHVDTFGNISQVFSTYESRWKADDPKPFQRGVNSFQLFFDGHRWWVVSVYWQGEDDKLPLPKKWL